MKFQRATPKVEIIGSGAGEGEFALAMPCIIAHCSLCFNSNPDQWIVWQFLVVVVVVTFDSRFPSTKTLDQGDSLGKQSFCPFSLRSVVHHDNSPDK